MYWYIKCVWKNVTMIELYGVMKKIRITFKFQNETYVSMNHLFVHLIMASNYSRRIQNWLGDEFLNIIMAQHHSLQKRVLVWAYLPKRTTSSSFRSLLFLGKKQIIPFNNTSNIVISLWKYIRFLSACWSYWSKLFNQICVIYLPNSTRTISLYLITFL